MIDFNDSITTENKIEYTEQERRNYPRARCNLALQYRNLNKNYSQTSGALVKEISAGGMRFVSNNFLPVFALLKIELLPNSDIPLISLTARVAWIEKLPYNESFLIGVEFLNIRNQDRFRIADYVNSAPHPKG